MLVIVQVVVVVVVVVVVRIILVVEDVDEDDQLGRFHPLSPPPSPPQFDAYQICCSENRVMSSVREGYADSFVYKEGLTPAPRIFR